MLVRRRVKNDINGMLTNSPSERFLVVNGGKNGDGGAGCLLQQLSMHGIQGKFILFIKHQDRKRCSRPTFRSFVSREIPHGLKLVREFLHGRSIGVSHKWR